MTHCTSTTLACRALWSLGAATLTMVPSMKAMLEPRMVAARIQGPASGLQGWLGVPERMVSSSQGIVIGRTRESRNFDAVLGRIAVVEIREESFLQGLKPNAPDPFTCELKLAPPKERVSTPRKRVDAGMFGA